jgi:hypothetical protein
VVKYKTDFATKTPKNEGIRTFAQFAIPLVKPMVKPMKKREKKQIRAEGLL